LTNPITGKRARKGASPGGPFYNNIKRHASMLKGYSKLSLMGITGVVVVKGNTVSSFNYKQIL
jgi:hypothetical protein